MFLDFAGPKKKTTPQKKYTKDQALQLLMSSPSVSELESSDEDETEMTPDELAIVQKAKAILKAKKARKEQQKEEKKEEKKEETPAGPPPQTPAESVKGKGKGKGKKARK